MQPMGFPGGSDGKESACDVGDLGWEDPLEEGMATTLVSLPGCSSTLRTFAGLCLEKREN